MTPAQEERLVVAFEGIAASLKALAARRAVAPVATEPETPAAPKAPPAERFRAALPRVKTIADGALLWGRAEKALTPDERTELWKALADHVGRVAKIKNAGAVLKQELAKGAPSR